MNVLNMLCRPEQLKRFDHQIANLMALITSEEIACPGEMIITTTNYYFLPCSQSYHDFA